MNSFFVYNYSLTTIRSLKMVEREGIEPSKDFANRFTVCPLWPLGNLSIAGDGTRTRNLLITNQLLCRLSYTSKIIHYTIGVMLKAT